MSELLQLAKQLRSMTDEQLAELIHRRQIAARPKDFIELSQQLLTTRSIDLCLATLTAKELSLLHSLPSKAAACEGLLNTGLVFRDSETFNLLDSVQASVSGLRLVSQANGSLPQKDSADLLPVAAISIFETQQAITELLLDAEQRLVRVVNKGSVGLPDVKNLSQQLHKNLDFARNCYAIAQRIGLLRARDSRWWLTKLAEKWILQTPQERWITLVRDWFATLGPQATDELRETLLAHTERNQLIQVRELLAQVFPVADKTLSDRLNELASQAEWLGLAVSGQPTQALVALLSSSETAALTLIETYLPKPQRKLIAQGDQTLIATGPLPTDLEILVRTFAELEQVSIASTYRITPASVTFGLECGLSEAKIRETLRELTQTELPQPIDYLIKQAGERFARIRVQAASGPERSVVQASDVILLTEILNDQRLRPFAFQPITASALASRFEPEVIYFGLRENGFLAVRVDENGSIISPKLSVSWDESETSAATDAASALVAELRQTDARVGENPNDDDLLRQLQLAIKNKATLRVHLALRNGSEHSYDLKVSGLANGRLRGLDAKADAERVLPLSQITRVEF